MPAIALENGGQESLTASIANKVYLHFKEHYDTLAQSRLGLFLALPILFFVLYLGQRQYVHAKIKRKYKTKSLVCHPDGKFFSLRLMVRQLQAKNAGVMLEQVEGHFEKTNSNSFQLRLFGIPIYFTKEPENIKAILSTQFQDFALGIRYGQFKPALGDGIFTLDGEGWAHSRAMLRPQFHREQVASVVSLESHLQSFVHHIQKHKGASFDIQELFFRLTIDTATEFLFGESVHSLLDGTIPGGIPEDFEGRTTFPNDFNIVQSYLASRSYTSFLYPLIDSLEFRRACKAVHAFTQNFVQKALRTSQSELEEKSKERYVFIYELVKETRDSKALQDQLLNILLAGRDTTAGLLSFTFYELARNPHIYQKLREAVLESFGGADGNVDLDLITYESLKKCEYLKFVVREGLRLYPSVPVNFRVATRDTTLPLGGGPDQKSPFFVSKGSTVAYTVHATHRMVEYYGKDSHDFRPERWGEPQLKNIGWAYLPFNGGPRVCLGQQFALTEASYIIARIAQTFKDIRSHDTGPYPPKKNVQLTSMLQDGAFVSFTE